MLGPATQTTVQELPRPPRLLGTSACRRPARWTRCRSGLANRLVGNPDGAAGARVHRDRADAALHSDAVIALAGAHMERDARRRRRSQHGSSRSSSAAGTMLAIGRSQGAGRAPTSPCAAASTCRRILGSRATFTLGRFGGHGGRALQAGDVLHIADEQPPADDSTRSSPNRRAPDIDRTGRSACSTARTARPTSSPTTTSQHCSPRHGRCTTTPTAPACA